MEMSNQQPKPEDCPAEGEPVDLKYFRVERQSGSVSREKREPQAGPASCLSNSASKGTDASGESVERDKPKIEVTGKGEVAESLPGSQSVARAEGNTSNEGGPENPCRTNCEGQAGRQTQRQGVAADSPGVGLVHSIQGQGASPDPGEGTLRRAHARASCSEEPGAGIPPAGICEGGAGQPVSLPRHLQCQVHRRIHQPARGASVERSVGIGEDLNPGVAARL